MIRNCESLCHSVSQLRRDYQKMANHFSFLKSNPDYDIVSKSRQPKLYGWARIYVINIVSHVHKSQFCFYLAENNEPTTTVATTTVMDTTKTNLTKMTKTKKTKSMTMIMSSLMVITATIIFIKKLLL